MRWPTAGRVAELSSSYGDLTLVYPAEVARRGLVLATVKVYEMTRDAAAGLPGDSLLIHGST